MAIRNVESVELFSILDNLSVAVDLNKDLPMNVFIDDGLLFWFFERPLICFFDILVGLVSESFCHFKSDVLIKFSGGEPLLNTCFSFGRGEINKDAAWLGKGFENFFSGSVGYPILLFNGARDWIAFESSQEEFGVIAVKPSAVNESFCSYLNTNFITMDELAELAVGTSAESIAAKALLSSYGS